MRSAFAFLRFSTTLAQPHPRRIARQTRKCRFEALELRTLRHAAPSQPVTADPSANIPMASPPLVGVAEPMGSASPAWSSAPPSSALTPQQIRTAYGFNLLSQDGAGLTDCHCRRLRQPKVRQQQRSELRQQRLTLL